MLSDANVYMQGLQDRRLDTNPEPVSHGDVDISNPNILQERPYRNRRSPIIVELGKEEIFTLSHTKKNAKVVSRQWSGQ